MPRASIETAQAILKGESVSPEDLRELADNFVRIVELIDTAQSYLQMLEDALRQLKRF